jgi:tetratricopeptide (TPR) repeat protein
MRSSAAILLFSMFAALASAQFVDYSLVEAQKLHEKGQIEEALKRYEEALVVDDPTGPLLVQMGIAFVQLGRFDEAKEAYEEALTYSPGDLHARYNLAAVRYRTGELEPALEVATGLHEQLPDNDAVSRLLALIYLESAKPANAVALMEPVHEKLPDNPLVSYILGLAYAEIGDYKQARTLAKKLNKSGKTAESHVLAGAVHFENGSAKKAAREFAASLALKKLRTVHRRLGLAQLRLGDPLSAEQSFRAELDVNPYDDIARQELARVVKQQGRADLLQGNPE